MIRAELPRTRAVTFVIAGTAGRLPGTGTPPSTVVPEAGVPPLLPEPDPPPLLLLLPPLLLAPPSAPCPVFTALLLLPVPLLEPHPAGASAAATARTNKVKPISRPASTTASLVLCMLYWLQSVHDRLRRQRSEDAPRNAGIAFCGVLPPMLAVQRPRCPRVSQGLLAGPRAPLKTPLHVVFSIAPSTARGRRGSSFGLVRRSIPASWRALPPALTTAVDVGN